MNILYESQVCTTTYVYITLKKAKGISQVDCKTGYWIAASQCAKRNAAASLESIWNVYSASFDLRKNYLGALETKFRIEKYKIKIRIFRQSHCT